MLLLSKNQKEASGRPPHTVPDLPPPLPIHLKHQCTESLCEKLVFYHKIKMVKLVTNSINLFLFKWRSFPELSQVGHGPPKSKSLEYLQLFFFYTRLPFMSANKQNQNTEGYNKCTTTKQAADHTACSLLQQFKNHKRIGLASHKSRNRRLYISDKYDAVSH